MGVYSFSLFISANTTNSNPAIETINVNRGIITDIEIYYPLNNNRFGKVWFFGDGKQLIPINPNGALTGNGNIQNLYPTVELFEPLLSFVGINSDLTFDHTITAVVTIKEPIKNGSTLYDLQGF